MLLYLDTCCLNRPHDDQRQQRIFQETEAIISLFEGVIQGSWDLASSEVLLFEVNDITRRSAILGLLKSAKVVQPLTPEIQTRANALTKIGFKSFDALHLASAEAIPASILLTTDDRFLRNSQRRAADLNLKVANPAKTDIFNP
ncbi:MAG: hypothetical protein JWO69_1897 [Thermoleophilia bacterium]|nr:hypothetical protein [Thermoleophilia bacterium]